MIPFILAAVGGYLIGDSFGEEIDSKITKFEDGGMPYDRKVCRVCVDWVNQRINEMSKEELIDYLGEKEKRLPMDVLKGMAFDKMYPEHHDKIHSRPSGFAKGGMTVGKLLDIQRKYDEYESENYHSEAVVLLAEHFGTKKDLEEAKSILKQHEKEGHLSSENAKRRMVLEEKLEKKWDEYRKIKLAHGGMMAKGGKTETYTYEIKGRDGKVLEKETISGNYHNVDDIREMIQDRAQKYIPKDATKYKTGLHYMLFRSNGDSKGSGTIRKKEEVTEIESRTDVINYLENKGFLVYRNGSKWEVVKRNGKYVSFKSDSPNDYSDLKNFAIDLSKGNIEW